MLDMHRCGSGFILPSTSNVHIVIMPRCSESAIIQSRLEAQLYIDDKLVCNHSGSYSDMLGQSQEKESLEDLCLVSAGLASQRYLSRSGSAGRHECAILHNLIYEYMI